MLHDDTLDQGKLELMAMIDAMPNTEFIFGLPGNFRLQALVALRPRIEDNQT